MSDTTAYDVAKYILQKKGTLSAMKLQKLVYYAQAWSTVWDDSPLFRNRIEAWANGPVVRDLYDKHRGQYQIPVTLFDKFAKAELSDDQKETIDIVLDAYGDKSAQWLSDQTHIEDPWLKAREGLSDTDRSETVIKLAAMADYYGSLK